MADAKVKELFSLFEKYGDTEFCGEKMSQQSHMLQAAMQAEADGQPVEVVLGVLFHDIGNLVGKERDVEHIHLDGQSIGPLHHDALGEEYLKSHGLPESVYCFAGHHGEAIRYQAAKVPGYADGLSASSKKILEKKGGPMSADEVKKFEALPHYDAIIKCRCWDEKARDPNAKLEPMDKYKKMCLAYLSK